jgi:2-C-methyl-D-erythritol 4-phosphate cytidylyltransferase/2-C-methyl-D-erythritol 2,4-cyclodiphosphate synthase
MGGRPVLSWSATAFLARKDLGVLVVVAPSAEIGRVRELLPADSRILIVPGGATRAASVKAGLGALVALDPVNVLIHDAARPGVSHNVINELLAALETADAACPALPVVDALKREGESGSLAGVERAGLVRVQTPQAFRYPLIRDAHAAASGDWVDDLALVEATGARIALTPGRTELMKITEGDDMSVAARLLTGGGMRVGSGFDVHAFAPGDFVTICGVRVPHTHRLEGHSDADVGWHAVTDAILGAAALGDIGDHFPPSDPQWKGAASIRFLQHTLKLAAERGWRVANVDLTLICERPKIGPHREAMRTATAEAMELPLDAVSVKATTTEKLGFTGRSEGIAAQAVVLLTDRALG